MKKILIFFFILGSLKSVAQEKNTYPDLLAMFVDEKFEKCMYKADKYTLNDKTKKDALPYLFVSRCYFEMSKRDEFKEKHPTAAKECFKYATKYIAKDKDRVFYAEHEDYFTELRAKAITEAELNLENKKYSQSKTYYDYLTDWDKNDAGAWLMMGVSFELAKQKKEAENAIKSAQKLLTDKTCSVQIKGQKDFLKNAIIYYAEKLYTEGNSAQAKIWLELGEEWFKDDKEYQVTYSQYAN
jgi:hypothetical protein